MDERISRLRQVIAAAQAAKCVDWFLDLDGTLVEIAPHPEAIVFPFGLFRLLRTLHRPPVSFVSIVSGRSVLQLRSFFGREGIILAGNHGLEVAGPGISFVHPAARQLSSLLESLAENLRKTLATVPGLLVEEKELTVTVHYRLVPGPERETLVQAVQGAVAPHPFRIRQAKEALEIIPRLDWGKGDAVRLILERTRGSHWDDSTVPVCIGDDRTDEDAFRFLRRANCGVTVRVDAGMEETSAEFRLGTPAAVRTLLRSLVTS